MTSQVVREYIDGAYCIQHLNKSKSEMLKSGLSGTHAENRDRFIGLGQKIYYALFCHKKYINGQKTWNSAQFDAKYIIQG